MEHHDSNQDREMNISRRTTESRHDLYPTFDQSDHTPESVLGGMHHFRPPVCSQQNTEAPFSANRTIPAIPCYDNVREVGIDCMHSSSASSFTWSPLAERSMAGVYPTELSVQGHPQAVVDTLILRAQRIGDDRHYRHETADQPTATGGGLGEHSAADLASMSHMQSNENHTHSLVDVKFGRTMGPLTVVPQSEYRHSSKAGQTRYGRPLHLTSIVFVSIGNGIREDGVIVEDALKGFEGCPVKLEGADDIVLEGSVVNITMHIMWPGLEPWKNLISTRCLQGKRTIPITRGRLAQRLAKALVKFMQHVKCLDNKLEKSATPSVSGLLSVPAAGQMVIRSLIPVTHGGWQVDLAVSGALSTI